MLGLGRILVPVDFSEPSKKAVKYGVSLAVEANAALDLVHVVPFVPRPPYAQPFEAEELSGDHTREIAERLLALIDPGLGGKIATECVVRAGDIRDELLDVAREHDVDLIVMGTHGRRRFERWFLGSVTEGVIRRSAMPVLTVSHLDRVHDMEESGPIRLRKILCATDLSAGSVAAMNRAAEWSRQYSAELIILHVLPDPSLAFGAEHVPLELDVDRETIRAGAVRRFRETVPDSIREDPRVRTDVADGVPYETILSVADKETVDLIVLNTSCRPGLERALLGSTAERVVRGSHVPVLSFPPPPRD